MQMAIALKLLVALRITIPPDCHRRVRRSNLPDRTRRMAGKDKWATLTPKREKVPLPRIAGPPEGRLVTGARLRRPAEPARRSVPVSRNGLAPLDIHAIGDDKWR
jgi:hypothetical protein